MYSLVMALIGFVLIIYCLILGRYQIGRSEQQCGDGMCDETVDIPFVSHLDAPLKAELDISVLNSQIRALIKKEVRKAINDISKEIIEKITEEKINVLAENLKTEINETLAVGVLDLKDHTSQLEIGIENLTESFYREYKKVAISACVSGGEQQESGIVRFPDVKMSVGISDVSAFVSSGVFNCEYPGLYHVTLVIMSRDSDRSFHVMKNEVAIMPGYTAHHDNNQLWHTSTISTAVVLDPKDTLWTKVGNLNVYNVYSCITIVKIS